MRYHPATAALVSALLLVSQSSAFALPSDGTTTTATLTEGKGTIFKRGFVDWNKEVWGRPEAARVGDTLQEGMQLGTGEKSWAQLSWKYITTRAWENSVYAIAPNQRLVYLVGGEMLFHLDKNRKDKQEYYVWTNLLQARIRGTTVMVQSTADTSRISVLEGTIDVLNRSDRSLMRLKPGVVYEVKSKDAIGSANQTEMFARTVASSGSFGAQANGGARSTTNTAAGSGAQSNVVSSSTANSAAGSVGTTTSAVAGTSGGATGAVGGVSQGLGGTTSGLLNTSSGLTSGLLSSKGVVGGLLGSNGLVGGLLGSNGLVGGLLGSKGLVGGLLGSNGVVGSILGSNGLVGGVLGSNGAVGSLLGSNGLVGGVLGGSNGLTGNLLGGTSGLLGGSSGLLGGSGSSRITGGLLGGTGGLAGGTSGITGGLLGGNASVNAIALPSIAKSINSSSFTQLVNSTQTPTPIYETAKTTVTLYAVNPEAVVKTPLVTGAGFESVLPSTGLINDAMSQLPSSDKVISLNSSIVRVPVSLSYNIGPAVGKIISIPATSFVNWPPTAYIGQSALDVPSGLPQVTASSKTGGNILDKKFGSTVSQLPINTAILGPSLPGGTGAPLPTNVLSNLLNQSGSLGGGATSALLRGGVSSPNTGNLIGSLPGFGGTAGSGLPGVGGTVGGVGGVGGTVGGVGGTVGGVVGGVGGTVGGVVGGVGGTVGGVVGGVGGTVGGVVGGVGGVVGGVGGTVGGVVGGVGGVVGGVGGVVGGLVGGGGHGSGGLLGGSGGGLLGGGLGLGGRLGGLGRH